MPVPLKFARAVLFDDVDPRDRQPRSGWNRLRRTLFLKLSCGYRR